MRTVIFVPAEDVWRRGEPGGLSLLERQMRQLQQAGFDAPLLLVPADQLTPVLPGALPPARIVRVRAAERDPFAALATAEAALPPDFVFLNADRVVDTRILTALVPRGPSLFASQNGGAVEPIGRVAAADVRRYGAALAAATERLSIETIDPYAPELRGDVPALIVPVRTPTERARAWEVLLDRVQKRTLDLPGEYFDTPFENFLVRRLAPTRVSPNQVTLATLLLALVVGMLFMHGYLRTGVLLALVVGVLDGVDGKLARLKLATSKVGGLEHVADFFYENFWYLAIATHLARVSGEPLVSVGGGLLVACDLTDNLLYVAVRARTGKMLDELGTFDRRFRRIAGRRNVYVMIFAAGFFGSQPLAGFAAASVWAGLTVVVHAARAAYWMWPRCLAPVSGAVADASASPSSPIEGADGLLVNEK